MKGKKRRRPLAIFRLLPVMRLRRMSRRQLSRKSGLPYPMVCRLTKGRANPVWATVLLLSRALDCSPSDFERRRRK